jgi:AcrR family transcriptional regulator
MAAGNRAAEGDSPVRERIVAAAVDLFAEQGYDATSVNEIVGRAAVAKGALYHHFAAKDDLLYEVYGALVERQLAGLREILAGGLDPAATVRALIADLVVTTADSAARAKVFAREGHRLGDAHQQRVRQARRAIHDGFRSVIERSQQDGRFRAVASPEMVTFTVFGVINELPVWYQPDGEKSADAIATELSDLVLAALLPPRG